MRETIAPCILLAEEVWGSGLQALRALGRHDIDTYIVTAGAGAEIYGRSRYSTATLDVEASDADSFVTSLLQWCDQLPDVHFRPRADGAATRARVPIIPLSDRLMEFLHRTRDRFDDRFELSIPEPKVAEALLDKTESLRIAERAGLDVPAWFVAQQQSDLQHLASLRTPIAIRPTSWSTSGAEYFKIAVAQTAESARERCSEALDRGATLIVQEYVTAAEDDVELAITWNHPEALGPAICTGRKRRQSAPEGGVMVWGEAVDLPDVRTGAERFLLESGYRGLGGIEFIRAGERSWFIEFNPRAEAIHFLASQAGLDTIPMEYDALSTGTMPTAIPHQGRATAWVGAAWLARLLADPGSWRTAVSDRVAFARSPSRIKAVWSVRDPLPSAALLRRLAERGLRSRVGHRARSHRPGGTP